MVTPKPQPCTLKLLPIALDDDDDGTRVDHHTKPIVINNLIDLKKALPAICQRIFNTLGSQQVEATYQRCLSMDLLEAGITMVHLEPVLNLTYKNVVVAHRRPDMIVELSNGERAVLEFKAVINLTIDHRKQLEYYLHYTGIDEGYLVNFPHDKGYPNVDGVVFDYDGLVGNFKKLVVGGSHLRPKNAKREVDIVHIKRTKSIARALI